MLSRAALEGKDKLSKAAIEKIEKAGGSVKLPEKAAAE